MNGAPPVASEVLAEISRGEKGRVLVRHDRWTNGGASVHLATLRQKDSGEWFTRRSVTLYAPDIAPVIAALEQAAVLLEDRAAEAVS